MTVKEIAVATSAQFAEDEKKRINQEKQARDSEIKSRGIKYPFQIASVKRTEKVLGIDAKLFAPTDKESLSPMELHSNFSRFELTIVDKKANITPTANIPAEDMYYIAETSRIALECLLMPKATQASEATSVAYTQKLIDKNFKGMTPAEVLLKDATQETALLNAKKWLEQNVARYPANKSQIAAIEDAIKLLHEGKLNNSGLSASNANANIEVYKTNYKFKTKKNEKGYNLIYGIEVICDPEKNYPFAVSIMNCYAPVETTSGGQKEIKMTEAENVVKSSMLLTKEEWIQTMAKMERVLTMFEEMNFQKQFYESQIAGQF